MQNRIKASFKISQLQGVAGHYDPQGSKTQQVEQIAQESHFQEFMFSIERKRKLKSCVCCFRD